MNPRIESVAVEPKYTLRLKFTNGEQRRVCLAQYLDVPVFARLRDPAFFGLARAAQGTVTWPGGVDFDPDTLYLDSTPCDEQAPAVAPSDGASAG
jgi:hypothetical protein